MGKETTGIYIIYTSQLKGGGLGVPVQQYTKVCTTSGIDGHLFQPRDK